MKKYNESKEKPIKLMQLRVPIEIYEKIREKSYLQRQSMQNLVTELLTREFLK